MSQHCRSRRRADLLRRRPRQHIRRLLLEKLEDRRVLATYMGTYASDMTRGNDQVHEIIGDVTIDSSATLTIEPGAIVKFHSTGRNLFIDGTLDAQGTAAENIVFTSIRDDVGAQPSDSEEVMSTAQGGDWEFRGIRAPLGPGAKHYESTVDEDPGDES